MAARATGWLMGVMGLLLACSSPEAPGEEPTADASHPPPRCRSYTPPRKVGEVAHPELNEISGLVASRRQPGVFYVHNDSGDAPRFFAIDETGRTLGEFRLPGAPFVDVEDVALGRCGEQDCLYFGDIGDNLARRADYAIYRVPEPQLDPTQSAPLEVGFDTLRIAYPDGSHDAETLLADPLENLLYVVTKRAGASAAYVLDLDQVEPGSVATLRKLGPVNPPEPGLLFTAGSFHPSGGRGLLRAYGALHELRGEPGDGLEGLLRKPWFALVPPDELQGEAVGYLADGSGYLSIPEAPNAPISRADCR